VGARGGGASAGITIGRMPAEANAPPPAGPEEYDGPETPDRDVGGAATGGAGRGGPPGADAAPNGTGEGRRWAGKPGDRVSVGGREPGAGPAAATPAPGSG
jgi:hypothetical protein